jgi:hypothetical protein
MSESGRNNPVALALYGMNASFRRYAMMQIRRLSGIAIVLSLVLGWAALAEPSDKAQAGSVSGTVLKDGKPAANVRVGLAAAPVKIKAKKHVAPATQPAEPTQKREKHRPLLTATTDADGKFTLDGVAPGEYVVLANERGVGRGNAKVSVQAGDSATVTIDLQPPKTKDKVKKANKLGL